jgi:hypothetical protein
MAQINLEDFEKKLFNIIGKPSSSFDNMKTWEIENQSLTLEYPHNTKNGYIHLMFNY